jgi:hypothetical protein
MLSVGGTGLSYPALYVQPIGRAVEQDSAGEHAAPFRRTSAALDTSLTGIVTVSH